MIADVIRLGSKFTNLWMSFEVDITELKENLDLNKEFQYASQEFPPLFILATSRVLDKHPAFLGHVKGEKIELPTNIRMRISSKNIKGRTVSQILTNPHLMSLSNIKNTLKKLVIAKDELLLPQQRLFFSLPWWARNLIYWYWLSSNHRKALVFGNCYLVCNGSTKLNGPIITHVPSPWALAIYFSTVYKKENRYYITLSLTADHRILDAYHLNFFAECLQEEFKLMANNIYN